MDKQTLKVDLNFASLISNYLVALQHLFDGLNLLKIAAADVTEEKVSSAQDFMPVYSAGNAHLPFQKAKEYAQDWLLRAFLRDSIENVGLFLDEALSTCSLIELVTKKQASSDEVNYVVNELPLRYHKIPFPGKLAKLEQEFGIRSPLTNHVISINRARTCVVHRLGNVSSLDVDDTNHLNITWLAIRLVVRGNISGKEFILDQPNLHLDEGSTVTMQTNDQERKFALGDRIRLTIQEIYATIFTLAQFGISIVTSIEEYARTQGIAPSSALQTKETTK